MHVRLDVGDSIMKIILLMLIVIVVCPVLKVSCAANGSVSLCGHAGDHGQSG